MRRVPLAGLLLCFLFSGGLLTGLALQFEHPQLLRRNAQHLWNEQKLTNYQLMIHVEMAGRHCLQEVQVRDGQHVAVLSDSCHRSWLSELSVARLFELSQRLEQQPQCFPSNQNCLCRRIRIGKVSYHPEFGYPETVSWNRSMQPSFAHIHYWQRVWEMRRQPVCGPYHRSFNLTVVSLTPLP